MQEIGKCLHYDKKTGTLIHIFYKKSFKSLRTQHYKSTKPFQKIIN